MYNPLPIDGVLVISVGGNPGSAIGRKGKLLSHPIGLENTNTKIKILKRFFFYVKMLGRLGYNFVKYNAYRENERRIK